MKTSISILLVACIFFIVFLVYDDRHQRIRNATIVKNMMKESPCTKTRNYPNGDSEWRCHGKLFYVDKAAGEAVGLP